MAAPLLYTYNIRPDKHRITHGGFMKLVITLGLLALLSACGNTKSNSPSTTSALIVGVKTQLAECNKASDSNLSFNTAAAKDQSGQINPEYVKVKFNFINANITKSGNVLKFFKWRVTGGQSVLDQTPLNVATYDFSTGQTNSSAVTSIPADQFNGQYGVYVQLNDPSQVFQVLKVVAYDSTGAVIGNLNTLIPVYAANPTEYALNPDGTARSVGLQQLHSLYGTTKTFASALEYKQYFDQYCF